LKSPGFSRCDFVLETGPDTKSYGSPADPLLAQAGYLRLWAGLSTLVLSSSGGGLFDERPETQTRVWDVSVFQLKFNEFGSEKPAVVLTARHKTNQGSVLLDVQIPKVVQVWRS
jgi:hypothetical protein